MTRDQEKKRPYWPIVTHSGTTRDLSHLEPFCLGCLTPDNTVRQVRVIFSSHVFTRLPEDGECPADICIDGRVFSETRYADSFLLPAVISGLPGQRVFQTWERRNYLRLMLQSETCSAPLHIFFSVKKQGNARQRHVLLRVESAYRDAGSAYLPPARPNAIRFNVLVQSVIMERPLKFAVR